MVKKNNKGKGKLTKEGKDEIIISKKEEDEKKEEEEDDFSSKEVSTSKNKKVEVTKEGANNAPGERDTSLDGSQTPSHNLPAPSSKSLGVPDPKVADQDPVPPAALESSDISDDTKGGAPISSSSPIVEWREASTMPTILQLKTTPKLWNMYWHVTEKIDSFSDPISFHDAKLRLIRRMKDKYDYLLVGVESDFIDPVMGSYRRITKPGALGFDLPSIVKLQLTAAQRNINETFLRSAIDGDTASEHPEYARYKVWHQYIGLQEEFNIIELAQQRENWYLIPINRILEYVKLWNTRDKMLRHPRELPAERKLLKYPFRGITACYEHMMDRSQVVRRTLVKSIHQWIGSNVVISIPEEKEEGSTWRKFAEGVKMSVTTFNQVSRFPNSLSFNAGSDMAIAMITALSLGKWAEIHIPIAHDMSDINIIVGCIMCKILLPMHILSSSTVLAIDNYLFKYLMPLLSIVSVRQRAVIATTNIDGAQSVNHLSMFLRDGRDFTRQHEFDIVQAFLLTKDNGSGWNFGGLEEEVGIPHSARMFINPARWLRYCGYFGDVSHDMDVSLTQFDRATAFLSVSGLREGKSIARDIGNILDTAFTQGGLVRARSMRIYVNYLLNKMGLLSIVSPISPREFEYFLPGARRIREARGELGYRHQIEVSLNGAASMLWCIDWDKYKPRNGFEQELFETGLSIIDYFTEFTTKYHYVNDHFKASDLTPELAVYTSTDRYNMLMANMQNKISLSSKLEELVGAKPWLYDLKDHIPPKDMIGYDRIPEVLLLRETEKLINAYPHFFGYVPKFYMTHRGSGGVYDTDSRLYAVNYRLRPDARIIKRVSFQELVEALTSANGFVAMTSDLQIDDVIEFNFPVMFDTKEIPEDINITDANVVPFRLDDISHSASDLIKKIMIVFRLNDDLVNVSSNGAGLRWTPIFAVRETLPYIPQEDIPFSSLVHKIETWKKETIRIWKDIEFLSN